MAFTSAQKQAIRNYLGVAGVYPYLRFRLEGAIEVIGGDTDASASMTTWLTRLAAIDTALTGAGSTSGATYGALKKVDEVEFYPVTDGGNSESGSIALVEQGRVLIQRISRLLGMWPDLPCGDYFGTGRGGTFSIALG